MHTSSHEVVYVMKKLIGVNENSGRISALPPPLIIEVSVGRLMLQEHNCFLMVLPRPLGYLCCINYARSCARIYVIGFCLVRIFHSWFSRGWVGWMWVLYWLFGHENLMSNKGKQ